MPIMPTTPIRRRTPRMTAALLRAGLASIVALAAAPAAAQVTDVEPYTVAVTRDAAPLRSGDLERFYKVAELPQGTILTVTGESQAWRRVEYPAGIHVALRADEAERDGNTVRLTKPAKLRALNLTAGLAGSWKSVLRTPLPEGTTLDLISVARNTENQIEGYIVRAPADAAAFIGSALVERATAADIAAPVPDPVTAPIDADLEPEPEPAPEPDPEPAAADTDVSADAETTTPATDAETAASDLQAELDAREAEAAVSEEVQARADAIERAMSGQPATPATPTAPADTTPDAIPEAQPSTTPTTATPIQPVENLPATSTTAIFALEDAFEVVRRQPLATAELDRLISRFETTIAALGDSPRDQRIRGRLDHRLKLLTLKRDYRNRIAAAEAANASGETTTRQITERLETFRSNLDFDYVGRITPSAIYNGRELPLMYRLESIPTNTRERPTTLGYLPAWPELRLDNLVGQTVGIAGSARFDDELNLRVIDPLLIEPVTPKSTPARD